MIKKVSMIIVIGAAITWGMNTCVLFKSHKKWGMQFTINISVLYDFYTNSLTSLSINDQHFTGPH